VSIFESLQACFTPRFVFNKANIKNKEKPIV